MSGQTDNVMLKSILEIEKLHAETVKLQAETVRINQEIKAHPWLPVVLVFLPAILGSAGIGGGIVALFIAYHK